MTAVLKKNSKFSIHLLDRISDVAFDGNTCKTSASGSVNSTGLEPELLTRFELSSSGSKGDVIILNLNFSTFSKFCCQNFFCLLCQSLASCSVELMINRTVQQRDTYELPIVQRSFALKVLLVI